MDHEDYMRRALTLARRGLGRVSPNPAVGAVVVRKGRVVGEGYHLYRRRHHAEGVALERAGRRTAGASLYLNLEPCVHFGRTPPCVDRILAAGIQRVFVSMRDPNPLVSGRGIRRLRRHGVEVQVGLLAQAARHLNEAFCHSVQTGRPFVLLKLALTLDGRMATRSGDSQWITGGAARRQVHLLRYRSDAILVGIETMLADDPDLSVRRRPANRITKVILDSDLRTPPGARIFRSGDPVIIFHRSGLGGPKPGRLAGQAELCPVPRRGDELDWDRILALLGERKITSLMVEGGARVAASALRAGVVQKVVFFYGPSLIGASGRPAIGELRVDRLADAVRLRELRLRRFPPDFLVEGYLRKS